MSNPAWGVGIATLDAQGNTLDVRFRALGLGALPNDLPTYQPSLDTDRDRGVALRAVEVSVDTDEAPTSSADAYLRLNLLSHRIMNLCHGTWLKKESI